MLAEAKRIVSNKLARFPAIAGAYLFGSILDSETPRDIDVGLVIAPAGQTVTQPMDEREALRLEEDVAAALGTLRGKRFDVSALSTRDIFFSMTVLRRGQLVYTADYDTLTDFIEYVSRRHSDLYPRYRRAFDEVLEEVRS